MVLENNIFKLSRAWELGWASGIFELCFCPRHFFVKKKKKEKAESWKPNIFNKSRGKRMCLKPNDHRRQRRIPSDSKSSPDLCSPKIKTVTNYGSLVKLSSSSSSSNKVHPSVIVSIIELVLCTFADKEASD